MVEIGIEMVGGDPEGVAEDMTDMDHRPGGEARHHEADMTEMIVVEEAEVATDEGDRTRDRDRGRRDVRRHTRGQGRGRDRGRDHHGDVGLEGKALLGGRIIGQGKVRLEMGMVAVVVEEEVGGGAQATVAIVAGVEVQPGRDEKWL